MGVTPNIGATWLCIWLIELIFNKEKLFTMKQAICSSGIVFTLALIFEIISNIYNGTPFDTNNSITTIIAITIYLATLYFKRNSVIEE